MLPNIICKHIFPKNLDAILKGLTTGGMSISQVLPVFPVVADIGVLIVSDGM